MKLEINITKTKFWTIMSLMIVLVGLLVYAANPEVFGHYGDEIVLSDGTPLEEKISSFSPGGSEFNDAVMEWVQENCRIKLTWEDEGVIGQGVFGDEDCARIYADGSKTETSGLESCDNILKFTRTIDGTDRIKLDFKCG